MKKLPICLLLLSILTIMGCSSNRVQYQSKEEDQPKALSQIEETDAFVKLVEKHLSELYRVEKQTTADGYHERGNGTLAMYFQGDYVIKKEENIEIQDVLFEEETYLYNLKPIYHIQKITYPNGKIENNKIYLKNDKITRWVQNGLLITNANQIKSKEKMLLENFERFR